ncbi:MAG: MCE family protein [Chitinophagaceae bacterium]|nr:MAG: MCE family protein [Chitinophagaceae bacterium]
MKISNETKVGALTAIAIVILIMGFNFLKGRSLTERNDQISSIFPDIKGLQVSNPVFIKGLQVGKIYEMHEKDNDLSGIIVTFSLTKNINIPDNSVAVINSDILGSNSLEIKLGSSKNFIKHGDTLQSTQKLGIMTEITNSLNPALNNVNKTLASLDGLIQQLSAILDPKTQGNLQGIIASLTSTSKQLERLIAAQSAALGKTVNNVEAITGTFARNSGRIDSTIANLQKTTGSLADGDIDQTLQTVRSTMGKLEQTLTTINSKNGSLGMLLNDRQLYNELRMTNRSLTTLLDDIRVNPKRYVSISVFGKKQKTGPILQPIIYDSTQGN